MQNATDDMLVIKNLVKRYKNTTAVNDVSLTVGRGQFFGFLGPNGAGKSSTIHCITGISRITSGSITIDGTNVETDYKAARSKVGLSPQEFNVDFFGKVWKILDYVAGYYGMQKAERREQVERMLERFDLYEHRNKSFRELSGGLKRRAIVARALIHDPELLILDEPTAGIDVEQRHDLWKYFRELNEAGKTIILTSHYLEEVELLCNEIAIINKGKIAAQGTKQDFTKDGVSLESRYLSITKGESY